MPEKMTGKAPVSATVRAEIPDAPARDAATIDQRRSELQAQIDAAQRQHQALQLEHDRIAALVASHQNEGERKLAALQSQYEALQRREAEAESTQTAKTRDQFSESARNQLEDALSLDREYRAQLDEAATQLDETNARLRELRSEFDALQPGS